MIRPYVKIGVAGTHSTGKSSLLNALLEIFTNEGWRVGLVNDLAISARGAGLPILHQQTDDTALWIMAEGIRREIEVAQSADIILVDRPLFDALGYLEAALEITGRERDPVRHAILETLVTGYAPDYDLLIVTELDANVPLGEGRDTDEVFRAAAGRRITAVAERLPVSQLKMNSENATTVQAQVVAFIRERLKSVSR